jgi:hypothetical protein
MVGPRHGLDIDPAGRNPLLPWPHAYLEVTRDLKEEEHEATSVWFAGVPAVAQMAEVVLALIVAFA